MTLNYSAPPPLCYCHQVSGPDSSRQAELRGRVSIVRELHVYGTAVAAHTRGTGGAKHQHQGYGSLLMEAAEDVARREHRWGEGGLPVCLCGVACLPLWLAAQVWLPTWLAGCEWLGSYG